MNTICKILNEFVEDLVNNNNNNNKRVQRLFNNDITWELAVPSFMMKRNTAVHCLNNKLSFIAPSLEIH